MPIDIPQTSERLQSERKRLKLSQDQVAEICGTTRKTINTWEAPDKEYVPNPAALVAMAEAGMNILFVLTGQQDAVVTQDTRATALESAMAPRLKEERQRLGYRQFEFAELCRVTYAAYKDIELGIAPLGADALARAAQCGLDVSYVVTGERSAGAPSVPGSAATFGERLKQERQRLGLSQKDIHLKIGVSRGSMSMYESGETSPSVQTLMDLMGLGFDARYLLEAKGAHPAACPSSTTEPGGLDQSHSSPSTA